MRQIPVRRRGLMCFRGRVSEAVEAGQGRSPSGARARPRPKRVFVRRRCFQQVVNRPFGYSCKSF